MKINDLNIIAQRLGAFGKEHLGIDPRGHTVPTTSSLGGRIVNWIRSRHSDTAAQANRDVMDGLINTIRQTDDLGDRFADIARKSLEDKLAAGRPLSGRDAARVLRTSSASRRQKTRPVWSPGSSMSGTSSRSSAPPMPTARPRIWKRR